MRNYSETYKEISKLKEEIKTDELNYQKVIDFKLASYSQNGLDKNDLDSFFYGLFPVELNKIGVVYDSEKSNLKHRTANEYGLWNCADFPAEQLLNYEWRYTDDSAKRITESIFQNYSKDAKICCLGTPTIALELIRENKAQNTLLLDINRFVIERINQKFATQFGIRCEEYNAINQVKIEHTGKFDIALINPPWYLDYYLLFIHRSLELLKKGEKTILVPLFPLLCRESAIPDLEKLFSILEESGCEEITSLGWVDFETPEFEKRIFDANNIHHPPHNWRKAELVKLTFSDNSIWNQSDNIKDYEKWDAFEISTKRLFFVNENELINLEKQSPQLITKKSVIDISRKNRSIEKILIWDLRDNSYFSIKNQRG